MRLMPLHWFAVVAISIPIAYVYQLDVIQHQPVAQFVYTCYFGFNPIVPGTTPVFMEPTWSIGVEMMFYVTTPFWFLYAFAFEHKEATAWILFASAALVSVASKEFLADNARDYFVFWFRIHQYLAGVLLQVFHHNSVPLTRKEHANDVIFWITLFINIGLMRVINEFYVLPLIMLQIWHADTIVIPSLHLTLFQRLADVSFPLYLIHLPLAFLFHTLLQDVPLWFSLALYLHTVFTFAWLLHLLFEVWFYKKMAVKI